MERAGGVGLSFPGGERRDGSGFGGRQAPTVRFCTIQTFKGLESSVVILVDLTEKMDAWDDKQSLLYVGLSRARTLLALMIHENARASFEPLVKRLKQ